jgi:hypothetical protein
MHEPYAAGRSRLEDLAAFYRRHGFRAELAESYIAYEVFPSREALDYRLVTSPTIESFDPAADAPLIDRVVAKQGLRLTVHRLVFVTRKP